MSTINVERFERSGLSFTTVTDEDSESLRAFVALPFATDRLQTNDDLPHETPHLLEHVVCDGDGTIPAPTYRAQSRLYGGYSNAATKTTNNGRLHFESIQPENHPEIIAGMFRAVRQPYLGIDSFNQQREIVRGELIGRLQDPGSNRSSLMSQRQGIIYHTAHSGLETLDAVSLADCQTLYESMLSKQNLRFVLSGSPKNVHDLVALAEATFGDTPDGVQLFSRSNRVTPTGDYHAEAPEMRPGDTIFSYLVATDLLLSPDSSEWSPEIVADIALGSLTAFLDAPEHGLHDQSRVHGLSYGLKLGSSRHKEQWAISVSDTVAKNNVLGEVALLDKRLLEATEYDTAAFTAYRLQESGRKRIQPATLQGIAGVIEQMAGTGSHIPYGPHDYREALDAIDAGVVVAAVRKVAAALQQPAFTNRVAFGENPFEQ